MSEIRLGYTASQINELLHKINTGETLTNSEKDKLLNINFDLYVKDDDSLISKIQNEIVKSSSYLSLKNTVSRVVLGRYIIRYNDLDNTLDFSYTDNDLIQVTYGIGSIDHTNGEDKDNAVCLRTVNKIEVNPEGSYSLYFLKSAKYLKYYLYNSDGTFIKASDEINPTAKQSVKIELTSDTAFIRYKFASQEETIATALTLADYIDLYQAIGDFIDGISFEIGSFNGETGATESNGETIRTQDYITIERNYRYILTTPEKAKYFRFYFYDSNKNFISRSESKTISGGGSIETIPPTNAAYMKFKFATSDSNQSTALAMAQGIILTKSAIELIDITWIQGEYDANGNVEETEACARTQNPIILEKNCQYVITFPSDVLWFRYYFYTSSDAMISRSDSMDVYAGESVTITPPTNAVKMTMKFGTSEYNWQYAMNVTSGVTFVKKAK